MRSAGSTMLRCCCTLQQCTGFQPTALAVLAPAVTPLVARQSAAMPSLGSANAGFSTLAAASLARPTATPEAAGSHASPSSSSSTLGLAGLAGALAAAFGLPLLAPSAARADSELAAAETTSAPPATASQPPAAGGAAVPLPLSGPFQLPELPYALDALEPHMSGSTLAVHWGKHHRTYLENLNKQVAGGPLEAQPLEEVVKAAWNGGKPTPAFNNAAQAWNHDFFWRCMKPGGGGAPAGGGELAAAIERDFGSLEQFKAAFKAAGLSQFGSGWAWLVSDHDGKLSIMKTGNAVTPMASGWNCLLVADVWEHAYYLDYQNRRADFLEAFLNSLVDWPAAEARYQSVLDAEDP